MINKIKTIITSLAMLSMVGIPALVPAVAHAQLTKCEGITACADEGSCNADKAGCDKGEADTRINDIIKLVINIFSLIVGVVAVIMIIIGGLKYITSGGDSGNITGAKNTILYAIIGLVVIVFAQVVVRFVLKRVAA